jgi:hypothetical protein
LQRWREHRGGLRHAQLLARIFLARCAKAGRFVILAAEAAHHAIALDGLRGDVGEVAHRHLDLAALLAEFAAGAGDHDADHGQDGDHHQGELPVHPQQEAEQEDHDQAFAHHGLDGVGGGAGDHGDVVGDARDQMPGTVLVEIAVGQAQQAVEQRPAQGVDHTHRDFGDEVVAEVGADALPDGDQHQHQRHRVQHFHAADKSDTRQHRAFGMDQAVDEEFQQGRLHRLCRRDEEIAENTDCECADEGPDIAQQPTIDCKR